MDPVGFQEAVVDFESLPSDSKEALGAVWNDGLTGAINRIAPEQHPLP